MNKIVKKEHFLNTTIIKMRTDGLSIFQIARELKIRPDKVWYLCKKIGCNRAYLNEMKAERDSIKGELEKGYPHFME